MVVSRQRGLPDPLEYLPKRGIAAKVCAEKYRIDKKTNQPLSFQPIPIGNVGPHTQVFLTRETVQDYFEGGQERHKQCGIFLTTQPFEGLRKVLGDYEGLACRVEVP